MKAKMNLPKERCLSSHTFGVYPNHHKLPSSLCCFRIMQLRTGVIWLAYGEMVWITSQLSYWAAQAVTGGFPQAVTMIGFLFTFAQIVFVLFLLKGVKEFQSSFIACYLCGLAARTLLYIAFLVIIGFVNLFMKWEEDDEDTLMFFRTKVAIKVVVCAWYTVLKIYLFVTVYRFYTYITEMTEYFRCPPTAKETPMGRQSRKKWRATPVEEAAVQA
ncbi:hypothetical protein GCK32_009327 [Trichostrongylus colubriformis]|uniref:Uncharacterized protein n=1 Tax=Trichostrongylus colubriformis TaxID=6319 RepID=A0AAN8F997_TRICO